MLKSTRVMTIFVQGETVRALQVLIATDISKLVQH